MKVNLEHVIFALADTVDLVGVDELFHGKRVAYMAWQCANVLGFSDERQRRLLHLGLLHDCGVSSTEERVNLVKALDWENSFYHCNVGAERLMNFEPLSHFSSSIRYHHTRWDTLCEIDLDDEEMVDANLIFMLDRVDYLFQVFSTEDLLGKKDNVRHFINRFKGSYFKEELVDCFLRISANEAFWFSLDAKMLLPFFERRRKEQAVNYLDLNQLKETAEIFAEIVDAKSPFTAEHSQGVARLSKCIAELFGLNRNAQKKIEVAGLLHDLGKLQVPDRVLENPGDLTDEGLSYMRHHSFATYHILSSIDGLDDIAEWAGNHHEALNGSGYPFRKTADELSIESRIVAIADIYQALAQNRPYRHGRPPDKILEIIEKNVRRGRLDGDVFAAISANKEACYTAATGA